jgi:hypothetical protein
MDIDTKNKIKVEVILREESTSNFIFHCNDKECVVGRNLFYFDLLDNLNFYCEKYDDIGFEIVEILINDLHIFPLYMHKATPPTNWLSKPVKWIFQIDEPFYIWLHKIQGYGWIA